MLTSNDEIFKLFFLLSLLYKDYITGIHIFISEDADALKFDTMYKDFFRKTRRKEATH